MSGDYCTCGQKFRTAEDYRDHMPCEGTEAEQKITGLTSQLAKANARIAVLERAIDEAIKNADYSFEGR